MPSDLKQLLDDKYLILVKWADFASSPTHKGLYSLKIRSEEQLTNKGLAQKELKEQNNRSLGAEIWLWLEKSSGLDHYYSERKRDRSDNIWRTKLQHQINTSYVIIRVKSNYIITRTQFKSRT